MSCISIVDREENSFCFGCNTTGVVFGPICEVAPEADIDETIEEFREYLEIDPRKIDNEDLAGKWFAFCEEFNV